MRGNALRLVVALPRARCTRNAHDADDAEFMASSHTYLMRMDPYDEDGRGCTTFFWQVQHNDA